MAKNEPKNETAPVAQTGSALPAGFKSIVMNEPAYNVDGNIPAQGYLVEHVRMPDAKDPETGLKKAWYALRFVATAPTQGVTQDGELVDIKIGDRFFLGDSSALKRDDLVMAANHPNVVREVFIQCLGKKKIPGTAKTFRTFQIAVTDVSHSRGIPALEGCARPLPSIAPSSEAVRQLNGGQVAAGAGQVALSDN